METIKRFGRGLLKGWNIIRLKNGKFIPYLGITSQHSEGFDSKEHCENWIRGKYFVDTLPKDYISN